MSSALRTTILSMLCLLTLAACTSPSPIAAAPAATPAASPQISEPSPGNEPVLASGHYQLLMLYAST